MNAKAYFYYVVLGFALGSLSLIGCADSNYDLSDVDKTIAIGSEDGFELPVNSTTEMVLGDLLDIEDNDVIQVAGDGSYYFTRGAGEEDIEPAMPVVDEIPLVQVSSENDYDYDIMDVEEARVSGFADIADASTGTGRPIYTFSFSSYEQIADVLDIALAKLKAGVNVDLNFSDDLKMNVGNIEKLELDLPDFFDVDFESRYNDDVFDFEKSTNTLKFKNLTEEGVHLKIVLHGLDFNKGKTPDAHECYLLFHPDDVELKGSIWLDVQYTDANRSRSNETLAQAQEELVIHCHSSINETVMLKSATGNFTPEISLGENLGEFEINNLPDFLEGDDVHLNVSNPELRIWIDSNMDIQGLVNEAKIKAVDASGKEVVIDVDTKALRIDPHTGFEKDANGDSLKSTKTSIVVVDAMPTGIEAVPHTYYCTPKSGKLSDLLYTIPKKVSFDCVAAADETYVGTINLGYKNGETKEPWYVIQPSYEVYAPLAFNEGSAIVYRDSITGWNKDLGDIKLSKGATVVINADVINSIPLDLKLHAHALELAGAETWSKLDQKYIDVKITDENGNEDFKVKAGSASNVESTHIVVTITQREDGAFQKIDGITYSASALASDDPGKQGIILNNKTQTLQVENIAIKVKGKVVVDLND